jgi:hypothetical protein
MRFFAPTPAALLAVMLGCAGPPMPKAAVPAPRTPAPADPIARDEAHLIAQEAASARVTVTLHVDRVAHLRLARYLTRLGRWADPLEGTGIDPLRDVQRAFVAGRTSQLDRAVIVLQHSAGEARVAGALAGLQRAYNEAYGPRVGGGNPARAVFKRRLDELEERIRTLGMRFPDPSRYPFPAAYRVLEGAVSRSREVVLIAAPHPGLLVVLPPERVFAAFRMVEVAGLPAPAADEAIVLRAWDPERSLQIGPAWSRDVRYAEAVLALDPSGGGTLRFRALCTSPESARVQARVMTEQADRAQTLSIGGAAVRLFDPIEMRAEGDRVTMRARLFAQDVDWIVGMTMNPM